MQTVWSRSLRPQSTCRCISCTNPLPSTLSRRSTTGIFRKRLTASDAFTLLLGPVLGGAFIADTRAKDKRRREWDEKIAAVQAEVEQMRRNEIKPYSIRRRNLRRLPALSRSYSSTAASRFAVTDDEDSIGAVDCPSADEFQRPDQASADLLAARSPDSEPGHDFAELQNESTLDQATIEKCQRLQRLVAIKLALRMILHIHIGKSPRYINTTSDYAYDQGNLPQNVNELVRHLKQVSNSLKMMNSDNLRLSWRAYQALTRGETCSLDQDMSDLARQFRRGEINVAQLIEKFTGKLLSSSASPTVRGYVPFLSVLSRARFDELGFMVDGTMVEARLPYDRHAVFTLLWQYGKNKEAHYFDKLIKKLTTDSANAQFGEQWLWRNINGTLVPVPPSQDSSILQILIYTALKCNQPHRAEAWSTILAHKRTGNMWLSHVIRNFLKYYAAQQNWQKGQVWMQTALDRAEMLAAQGIRHLQRIAFSMLDFCVAYGERGLYRDILQAAVEGRLGVYSADPGLTLTQRSTDILSEWKSRHERAHRQEIDILSSVEKARIFTRKLQHVPVFERDETADSPHISRRVDCEEGIGMKSLNRTSAEGLLELEANDNTCPRGNSQVSDALQDEAGAGHWKELCRQQKTQLDMLKEQLKSLKSGQKFESASTRREQDRIPSGVMETTTESWQGITTRVPALQSVAEPVGEPRRTVVMRKASIAWRPLSSTSVPTRIPDQPFRISLPKLPPHNDQPPTPSSTPSPRANDNQLATSPPLHRSPPTVPPGKEISPASPASPAEPSKPKPLLRFHPPRQIRPREQVLHLHHQLPGVRRNSTAALSEAGPKNAAPSALPITWERTLVSPTHHKLIKFRNSGSAVPGQKVGYGVLRFQFGGGESR